MLAQGSPTAVAAWHASLRTFRCRLDFLGSNHYIRRRIFSIAAENNPGKVSNGICMLRATSTDPSEADGLDTTVAEPGFIGRSGSADCSRREASDSDLDIWRRKLFPERHVEDPWSDPLFLLYAPVGIVVAGARMLLWVTLLVVDSPTLTNNDDAIRILQMLLGISVTWTNTDRLPSPKKGRHVMVSNHITAGDLIALYSLPQRYIHLVTPAMPKAVTKVKHHRLQLRHATPQEYESLASEAEGSTGSSSSANLLPVHLFPEGGMTNGSGMLRFSRGFVRFSRGIPVFPMAMRVDVPLGINTHTLTSTFLANMFWFCFAPRVRFTCKVLEPVTIREGETAAQFASRVQNAISEELNSPISSVTIQAKRKIAQEVKSGSA